MNRPAALVIISVGNRVDFHNQSICLAEKPINNRLHNRLVGRYFENVCTWSVERGNDNFSHHSIMDID